MAETELHALLAEVQGRARRRARLAASCAGLAAATFSASAWLVVRRASSAPPIDAPALPLLVGVLVAGLAAWRCYRALRLGQLAAARLIDARLTGDPVTVAWAIARAPRDTPASWVAALERHAVQRWRSSGCDPAALVPRTPPARWPLLAGLGATGLLLTLVSDPGEARSALRTRDAALVDSGPSAEPAARSSVRAAEHAPVRAARAPGRPEDAVPPARAAVEAVTAGPAETPEGAAAAAGAADPIAARGPTGASALPAAPAASSARLASALPEAQAAGPAGAGRWPEQAARPPGSPSEDARGGPETPSTEVAAGRALERLSRDRPGTVETPEQEEPADPRGGSSAPRAGARAAEPGAAGRGAASSPDESGPPTPGAVARAHEFERAARGQSRAAHPFAGRPDPLGPGRTRADAPEQIGRADRTDAGDLAPAAPAAEPGAPGGAPAPGTAGAGDGVGAGVGPGMLGRRRRPDEPSSAAGRALALPSRPGASRAELVEVSGTRGFADPGYATTYAEYRQGLEATLERDTVPPDRRGLVQRYFHLIRPRPSHDR